MGFCMYVLSQLPGSQYDSMYTVQRRLNTEIKLQYIL